MKMMLDTSAYAAYMGGHSGIQSAVRQAERVLMNPVVLGELLAGFRRGRHEEKNRRELRTLLASPRVEVVDVDNETAERYAVIRNALWASGTPVPTNDIWIAASAMQHGAQVVTTDAHFASIHQIIARVY